MSTHTIFVTSATGTVGGAVARLALAQKWKVRTTTRDPASTAATTLSSLGVDVSSGDWDNEAALRNAISGCDFLFLNLFPDFQDFSHDRRQAQAILAIAKASGVKHVIYSNLWPRPSKTPNGDLIAHLFPSTVQGEILASKYGIEDDVRESGLTWTVLQPGFFMSNFLVPKVFMYGDFRDTGVWSNALLPTSELPLVDHEDIAKFTIAALQDPSKFSEQTIPISSEELTADEALAQISAQAGKKITTKFLTNEEIETAAKVNMFLATHKTIRDMTFETSSKVTKTWGLPLNSFKTFLEREKKAVDETWGHL